MQGYLLLIYKTQSTQFYGTAGLAFIEALCKARQQDEKNFKQQLIKNIEQRTQELLSNHTNNKDSAIRTIAQRCALIDIGHRVWNMLF